MLAFGFLVGNAIDMSLIGIVVGHSYYFLKYVFPVVAEIRGWKRKELLVPPRVFRYICGEELEDDHVQMVAPRENEVHEHQD